MIFGTRRCNAFFRQLGILAQRHPPHVLARIKIDGIQRAPGWLYAGVAFVEVICCLDNLFPTSVNAG